MAVLVANTDTEFRGENLQFWSRVSVVGVPTEVRSGWPCVPCSTASGGKKFIFPAKRPYCLWGPHRHLFTGYWEKGGLLGGQINLGVELDIQLSAEIRKKWSYNSTPPTLHTFDGDSFNFTLYFLYKVNVCDAHSCMCGP